jgi:hypothetical protein
MRIQHINKEQANTASMVMSNQNAIYKTSIGEFAQAAGIFPAMMTGTPCIVLQTGQAAQLVLTVVLQQASI